MKTRPEGFLSQEKIDHNSEVFDYIKELHDYLWQFVRCEFPNASGNIKDFVDIALNSAKHKNKQCKKRGI